MSRSLVSSSLRLSLIESTAVDRDIEDDFEEFTAWELLREHENQLAIHELRAWFRSGISILQDA